MNHSSTFQFPKNFGTVNQNSIWLSFYGVPSKQNQWVLTSGGKVIRCKCVHRPCLQCAETSICLFPFFDAADICPVVERWLVSFSPNQADTSASGITGIRRLFSLRKLYIILQFLQCSFRTGIFLQHRPIACEKTRIRQALPGKPELP